MPYANAINLGAQMKRVYINEEFCIGCRLCELYCRLEHSQTKNLLKAFKKESPQQLSCLQVQERKPVSFAIQCQHCTEAHCVFACLTGALHHNPDSDIVTVDAEKCIGCWTCILACPFGVIRQENSQGKITKCDLCQEADIPACVANCPNGALLYAEAQDRVST